MMGFLARIYHSKITAELGKKGVEEDEKELNHSVALEISNGKVAD